MSASTKICSITQRLVRGSPWSAMILGQALMAEVHRDIKPSELKNKELTGDDLELCEEAKVVVAARACLQVALVKIPECKTARSKAATMRECKRPISGLKVMEFPVVSHKDPRRCGNTVNGREGIG